MPTAVIQHAPLNVQSLTQRWFTGLNVDLGIRWAIRVQDSPRSRACQKQR